MKQEEKSADRLMQELKELRRLATASSPVDLSCGQTDATYGISHRQCIDIIEFLPDPTFVIDHERKVIAWNRAIEEMTGVSKEDMLGRGDYAYAVPFYGQPRPIMIDMVIGHASVEDRYDYVRKEAHAYYGESYAPFAYGGQGAYLWGKATALLGVDGSVVGAVESLRDITDRKLAEEALRKGEEKYRGLVESANSIIMRLDVRGRVTFFNDFAQRFFGYSASEILGANVAATIKPPMDPGGRDLSEMISDLGRHPERYLNCENENRRRNGEKVRVAWTNKALCDSRGDVQELLCVGNDISARIYAEEALRKSERRYRMLIETMNDGLRVMDEDGVITYANDKLCRMLGYPRHEIVGRPGREFFDKENLAVFEKEMAGRRLGNCSVYEIEFLAKDGRRTPTIVSGAPVFDESGVYRGGIGAVTDITDLKETERRLRESEEKYRMIFTHSPLGILHFDANGIITACNDTLVKIWGSSTEKLIGFNLVTSLKNKKMRSAVCACMTGRFASYEGNYLSVTGGKITNLKAHYGPIVSEDGSFQGGIGIIEDISERKQAE